MRRFFIFPILSFLFLNIACALPPYEAQEEIDEIVTRTALRTYGKINRNWEYTNTHAHTESEFWTVNSFSNNNSKISLFALRQDLRSRSFANALDDIIEKRTSAECMLAIKIVKLHCLKELLGEKFELLVERASEQVVEKTLIHCLSWQFQKEYQGSGSCVGATALTNIPEYRVFKPSGHAQSQNVICVGHDDYIGFDPNLFADGAKPSRLIEEDLYRCFASDEHLEDKLKEYHQKSPYRNKDKFVDHRREAQGPIKKYYFDLGLLNGFLKEGIIL